MSNSLIPRLGAWSFQLQKKIIFVAGIRILDRHVHDILGFKITFSENADTITQFSDCLLLSDSFQE